VSDYPRIFGAKNEVHVHVLVYHVERSQEAYNLSLGSVNADRLDHDFIQGFKINFSHRCVCTRTYRVDEVLEGILCDDDLINYSDG
jgi:hypothetical protein